MPSEGMRYSAVNSVALPVQWLSVQLRSAPLVTVIVLMVSSGAVHLACEGSIPFDRPWFFGSVGGFDC